MVLEAWYKTCLYLKIFLTFFWVDDPLNFRANYFYHHCSDFYYLIFSMSFTQHLNRLFGLLGIHSFKFKGSVKFWNIWSWMQQSQIDVDELILSWVHNLAALFDNEAQPHYHQSGKDFYGFYFLKHLISSQMDYLIFQSIKICKMYLLSHINEITMTSQLFWFLAWTTLSVFYKLRLKRCSYGNHIENVKWFWKSYSQKLLMLELYKTPCKLPKNQPGKVISFGRISWVRK